MDPQLVAQSLNFHGQQLTKIWEAEKNEDEIQKMNLKNVDYHIYHQRAKEFSFQERTKRLKLHQFVVKKSDMLFRPLTEEEQTLQKGIITQEDDHYAVMPSFEAFLPLDKGDRKKHLLQSVHTGDVVIGTVSSKQPQGLFVKIICLDGGRSRDIADINLKAFCPSTHIIPAQDKKELNRTYMTNDTVRCEVLEVYPDTEKLVLGMKGVTLRPEVQHQVKLGLISKEDVPMYFKRLQKMNKDDTFESLLESSVGFNNPNNTTHLADTMSLMQKRHSLMAGLRGEFPRAEMGCELRQAQSSKWAFNGVAEGVKYYKAGNYTEAFQCLNRSLSIDPKNVEGLVARGALYANSGTYDKAVSDFEEALNVNPGHQNARKYLTETLVAYGKHLEEENKLTEAFDAYEKCLKIVPGHVDAIEAIQKSSNRLGDRGQEAKDKLKQFLQEDPTAEEKKKAKKDAKKKRKKQRYASSSSSSSATSSSHSSSATSSSQKSSSPSSERHEKKKKKNREDKKREASMSPFSKKMMLLEGNNPPEPPVSTATPVPTESIIPIREPWEQPATAANPPPPVLPQMVPAPAPTAPAYYPGTTIPVPSVPGYPSVMPGDPTSGLSVPPPGYPHYPAPYPTRPYEGHPAFVGHPHPAAYAAYPPPAQPQKYEPDVVEYEEKVRRFLDQTRGDSEYEEKVRRFLEEIAQGKGKKDKKIHEKDSKKKKKKEKRAKKSKDKKKEEKKRKKKDKGKSGKNKDSSSSDSESDEEEMKDKKSGKKEKKLLGLPGLESLADLDELEAKLSAYYAKVEKSDILKEPKTKRKPAHVGSSEEEEPPPPPKKKGSSWEAVPKKKIIEQNYSDEESEEEKEVAKYERVIHKFDEKKFGNLIPKEKMKGLTPKVMYVHKEDPKLVESFGLKEKNKFDMSQKDGSTGSKWKTVGISSFTRSESEEKHSFGKKEDDLEKFRQLKAKWMEKNMSDWEIVGKEKVKEDKDSKTKEGMEGFRITGKATLRKTVDSEEEGEISSAVGGETKSVETKKIPLPSGKEKKVKGSKSSGGSSRSRSGSHSPHRRHRSYSDSRSRSRSHGSRSSSYARRHSRSRSYYSRSHSRSDRESRSGSRSRRSGSRYRSRSRSYSNDRERRQRYQNYQNRGYQNRSGGYQNRQNYRRPFIQRGGNYRYNNNRNYQNNRGRGYYNNNNRGYSNNRGYYNNRGYNNNRQDNRSYYNRDTRDYRDRDRYDNRDRYEKRGRDDRSSSKDRYSDREEREDDRMKKVREAQRKINEELKDAKASDGEVESPGRDDQPEKTEYKSEKRYAGKWADDMDHEPPVPGEEPPPPHEESSASTNNDKMDDIPENSVEEMEEFLNKVKQQKKEEMKERNKDIIKPSVW